MSEIPSNWQFLVSAKIRRGVAREGVKMRENMHYSAMRRVNTSTRQTANTKTPLFPDENALSQGWGLSATTLLNSIAYLE